MGNAARRFAGDGRSPVGGGRETAGLARARPGQSPALRPGTAGSDRPTAARHWPSRGSGVGPAGCGGCPAVSGLAAGGHQKLARQGARRPGCPGVAGGRESAGPVALYDRPRGPGASACRSVRPASSRRPGWRSEERTESATTVCPSCGAILPADQATCPDCGSVKDKPAIGACTGSSLLPSRANGWWCWVSS